MNACKLSMHANQSPSVPVPLPLRVSNPIPSFPNP